MVAHEFVVPHNLMFALVTNHKRQSKHYDLYNDINIWIFPLDLACKLLHLDLHNVLSRDHDQAQVSRSHVHSGGACSFDSLLCCFGSLLRRGLSVLVGVG